MSKLANDRAYMDSITSSGIKYTHILEILARVELAESRSGHWQETGTFPKTSNSQENCFMAIRLDIRFI